MSDQTDKTKDSNLDQQAVDANANADQNREQQDKQEQTTKDTKNSLDMQKEQEKIQAKLDQINQDLSELPHKIEKTIDDFRKKLDDLLGKDISPQGDPENKEFDPNKVIKKLTQTTTPVVSTTAPITALVGPIPIIGDLVGMLPKMAAQAKPSSSMSEEEIQKKVPNLPDIPPGLMDKVDEIKSSIDTACMIIPTIQIDLLFKMVDVIYSKLQTIDQTIPLGNLEPLNLAGSAITAQPNIKKFIQTAPSQVKSIAKGIIKKKLQEAMALAKPTKPKLDEKIERKTEEIKACCGKSQPPPEQTPVDKPIVTETPPIVPTPTSTPANPTFDDITKKWVALFAEFGFTRTQISRITNGWIKLYDGSDPQGEKSGYIVTIAKSISGRLGGFCRKQGTPQELDDWMQNQYCASKNFGRKTLILQTVLTSSELIRYYSVDQKITKSMRENHIDECVLQDLVGIDPKNPREKAFS